MNTLTIQVGWLPARLRVSLSFASEKAYIIRLFQKAGNKLALMETGEK